MTKRLLIAATLVLVGAAVILGPKVYRNDFVQEALNAFDLQDRRCLKAPVAKGVACPDGCVARPLRGPEERNGVPECRSRLWSATCGTACDPRAGLVRFNGDFASSGAILVELDGASDAAFEEAVAALGAASTPLPSGMFRYRVSFENPGDDPEVLETMRASVARLPRVLKVEYEVK